VLLAAYRRDGAGRAAAAGGGGVLLCGASSLCLCLWLWLCWLLLQATIKGAGRRGAGGATPELHCAPATAAV
jgi:hypothetical protein